MFEPPNPAPLLGVVSSGAVVEPVLVEVFSEPVEADPAPSVFVAVGCVPLPDVSVVDPVVSVVLVVAVDPVEL